MCFFLSFSAPELIQGGLRNSETICWNFGVLIYEFVKGIPPFYSQTKNVDLSKPLKFPPKMSVECADLLQGVILVFFSTKHCFSCWKWIQRRGLTFKSVKTILGSKNVIGMKFFLKSLQLSISFQYKIITGNNTLYLIFLIKVIIPLLIQFSLRRTLPALLAMIIPLWVSLLYLIRHQVLQLPRML
jgi:hypothetical protein